MELEFGKTYPLHKRQLKIGERFDDGEYNDVHTVTDVHTGETFALRALRKVALERRDHRVVERQKDGFEVQKRLQAGDDSGVICKVASDIIDERTVLLELLKGQTAKQVLEHLQFMNGYGIALLTAPHFLRRGIQALDHMRAVPPQFVHLDVHPKNYHLSNHDGSPLTLGSAEAGGWATTYDTISNSRIVLFDFDMARAMDSLKEKPLRNVGTPTTMAPEMLQFGAQAVIGTDHFGLGRSAIMWLKCTTSAAIPIKIIRSTFQIVIPKDITEQCLSRVDGAFIEARKDLDSNAEKSGLDLPDPARIGKGVRKVITHLIDEDPAVRRLITVKTFDQIMDGQNISMT